MEIHVKDRIVAASKSLFFSRGLRSVTMDEIASACGMSKKTLYLNFSSKEELLQQIMVKMRDGLVEEIRGILNRVSSPVLARLREVINAVSSHSLQFSPIFLEDMKRFHPEAWRELQAYKHDGLADAIHAVIREGQAQGYIRAPLSESFIIHVCFTLMDDILTPETSLELSMSFPDLFEQVMSLLFEGFLTQEGKKALYYIE